MPVKFIKQANESTPFMEGMTSLIQMLYLNRRSPRLSESIPLVVSLVVSLLLEGPGSITVEAVGQDTPGTVALASR